MISHLFTPYVVKLICCIDPLKAIQKNTPKKRAIPTPSRQDSDHELLEYIPDYKNMSNNGIDRNNSDNNGRNEGNDSLNENISSIGGNGNMGDGVNEDNSEQDDNELKKRKRKKKT